MLPFTAAFALLEHFRSLLQALRGAGRQWWTAGLNIVGWWGVGVPLAYYLGIVQVSSRAGCRVGRGAAHMQRAWGRRRLFVPLPVADLVAPTDQPRASAAVRP